MPKNDANEPIEFGQDILIFELSDDTLERAAVVADGQAITIGHCTHWWHCSWPLQYLKRSDAVLLRPQLERRHCRATEKRYELAPPHGAFPYQAEDNNLPSFLERGGLVQDSKINSPMSALGEERTSRRLRAMSALPLKADIDLSALGRPRGAKSGH